MEQFSENSKRTRRVADVQTILAGLVTPVVDFVEDVYRPGQIIIEDTLPGFDMNGDFHCPPGGRWDDMGNYMERDNGN